MDALWALIDEILNAPLFVLIGLEILVLSFTSEVLYVELWVIPAIPLRVG
ncbi:hypothetical protein [Chthoniobacter sp.]